MCFLAFLPCLPCQEEGEVVAHTRSSPHFPQETHDGLVAREGGKEGRPLAVRKGLGDVLGADAGLDELDVVGRGRGGGRRGVGAVLEDGHLGTGGGVGVEGGIESNKVFRLVLQIHNLMFKLHILLEEGEPGTLGVRAGAAVPKTHLWVWVWEGGRVEEGEGLNA